MRVLVLSDIHSNLAAFEAVLSAAGEVDQVWCMGDLVGYGPDPNECVERIREFPHICVAGNHDWGVLGKLDLNDFNPNARQACLWNREQLSTENRQYLDDLDERIVQDDFTLVHGSPRWPIWEYISVPAEAAPNFGFFETTYCFVGHTHAPIIFIETEDSCQAAALPQDRPVALGPERLIINPGGVGQPRDGDPRASYLILDTEHLIIEHHRIEYPIEDTQKRMLKAGLPLQLIARLGVGW